MGKNQNRWPIDDGAMQNVLCALIDQSGLSRYEIAKRVGLSEPSLSRHYNRLSVPSGEYLRKLSQGLGAKVTISIEWE